MLVSVVGVWCGWVESLVVQDIFESCDGESNLV